VRRRIPSRERLAHGSVLESKLRQSLRMSFVRNLNLGPWPALAAITAVRPSGSANVAAIDGAWPVLAG